MKKPKFKIGDIIKNNNPAFDGVAKITGIDTDHYYYVSVTDKYPDKTEHMWSIDNLECECYKITKLHKALL